MYKFNDFHEYHFEDLSKVFKEVITVLEDNRKFEKYDDYLIKMQIISNILTDNYNLGWDKYEIVINNDISSKFQGSITNSDEIEKIFVSDNVLRNNVVFNDSKDTEDNDYTVDLNIVFKKNNYYHSDNYEFYFNKKYKNGSMEKIHFTPYFF
ncbi:hypothetical protein [Tepidibacter aestuarii]|uniref:hypothetical protein n=1 Tax=Tepidibacter aestuarii TaxID=2925782 RepID=UPI0020BE8314|nr:hypothetical protein [Tepidibacter aestuarii]